MPISSGYICSYSFILTDKRNATDVSLRYLCNLSYLFQTNLIKLTNDNLAIHNMNLKLTSPSDFVQWRPTSSYP